MPRRHYADARCWCKPKKQSGGYLHSDGQVISVEAAPTPEAERRRIVSARLKEAREAAGMSQAQLAAATGLDAMTISHYERGVALPQFKNGGSLVVLAETLGLSLDEWLMDGVVWGRYTGFKATQARRAAKAPRRS